MPLPTLTPLGDNAIVVELGASISEALNQQVLHQIQALQTLALPGIIEIIPAYSSYVVVFQPHLITCQEISGHIQTILAAAPASDSPVNAQAETLLVPVCYTADFGPDLATVAAHNQLAEDAVIRLHAEPRYRIFMMGFSPGFAYLGGMSPKIATPRLQSPRARVESGSVGIAHQQTGIYPLASPGGWQIIGRTPLVLFDHKRETPVLFSAGQHIRFMPISRAEFDAIAEQIRTRTYTLQKVIEESEPECQP